VNDRRGSGFLLCVTGHAVSEKERARMGRAPRRVGDDMRGHDHEHGNGQPDTATLEAARGGDRNALDRLLGGCLPLVYNVVGRALDAAAGAEDAEDVVRETLLHVVRNLPGLPGPDGFRAWTLAVAMRLVRDRRPAGRHPVTGPGPEGGPGPGREPADDFVGLTVALLGLSGQRREIAEATRWLEPEDRDVLSVWWLAAAGTLTRAELATACGITPQHAAVRVQRMKARLDAARSAVRAMAVRPGCAELWVALGGWDGGPSPLWRKRIARHTRECPRCGVQWDALQPADHLLAGMPMVPVPVALAAAVASLSHPSVSHPAVVE
jgi:RNA polymerase sigma factor (sigma-70 family)